MIALAISLLWLLAGAIALCAVIYLVMYGIEKFIHPIPELVKQGIWFIVLLLMIIAVLTIFAGGGGGLRLPSFR